MRFFAGTLMTLAGVALVLWTVLTDRTNPDLLIGGTFFIALGNTLSNFLATRPGPDRDTDLRQVYLKDFYTR